MKDDQFWTLRKSQEKRKTLIVQTKTLMEIESCSLVVVVVQNHVVPVVGGGGRRGRGRWSWLWSKIDEKITQNK